MEFIETSAKTSDNVDSAFKKTTSMIYDKIKTKEIDLLNDVNIFGSNDRVVESKLALKSTLTKLKMRML